MPRFAEAVVIGSGVLGVNIALQLARRGCSDVVVIDAMPKVGGRTTFRCGGGVRLQFSTPTNVELSRRSLQIREELRGPDRQDLAVRPTGYLFVATDDRESDQLRAATAVTRSADVDAEWLYPAEVRRLVPLHDGSDVIGAAWRAGDGWQDAAAWRREELRAARRSGVQFLPATTATGIRVGAGRVQSVRTDRGGIATRAVINAAGPWAPAVAAMTGHELPIRALVHQVVMACGSHGFDGRTPTVIYRKGGVGFRYRNGMLVIGATDDRLHNSWQTPRVSKRFQQVIWERAIARVPAVGTAAPVSGFACLYDATPDDHALVGLLPGVTGLLCATGFDGHGFMHAPAIGEMLSRSFLSDDWSSELARTLAPSRFLET